MFSVIKSFAQANCDTVLWSASTKLTPADFKAVADTGKTMIAYTMSKWTYKAIPQVGSVIIITSTYFYPCSSWLNIANIKNSIVHEQLHFDIAEYHKRLFLKRVTETKASEDMFTTTTKAIFRDVAEQRRTINMEYDMQTNKGVNEQQQNKWNTKITNLLAELDKHAANTTTIDFR